MTVALSFCKMGCINFRLTLGVAFGDAMFIASEIPKIGENSENPDVSTVSEENS